MKFKRKHKKLWVISKIQVCGNALARKTYFKKEEIRQINNISSTSKRRGLRKSPAPKSTRKEMKVGKTEM